MINKKSVDDMAERRRTCSQVMWYGSNVSRKKTGVTFAIFSRNDNKITTRLFFTVLAMGIYT